MASSVTTPDVASEVVGAPALAAPAAEPMWAPVAVRTSVAAAAVGRR
jgi:hypothetical protein